MRKYKLIALVVLVAASLITSGLYSAVRHRQNVQAQTADVSVQDKQKQLQEWQEQVRMWEEQQAGVGAAGQSDLEQQGVEMLPDTGAGSTLALVGLTAFLSTIAYLLTRKYILNRYL